MAIDDLIDDFVRQRCAAGDDGHSFLIGLDGVRPVFAVAVGLRGEADHPRLLAFARYLLHRHFRCDGFALLLPAVFDGADTYVMERLCAGEHRVSFVGAAARHRPCPLSGHLIGDLAVPGEGLPGIVRRDMERLFEALERPLPPPAGEP